MPAVRRSCAAFIKLPAGQSVGEGLAGVAGDWLAPCGALRQIGDGDHEAMRQWLETWFTPWSVADSGRARGRFTGYYEIELNGARRPDARHRFPVYRRPASLVTADLGAFDGKLKGRQIVGRMEGSRLVPFWSRAEIGEGALEGQGAELLWLDDPVDSHLLHIQGSGRIRLSDGTFQRVGFAASNGRSFVGLGRILADHGFLAPGKSAMQDIRAWLKAHPGEATGLMNENPRYIFFRPIEGAGPIGAAGVPLTAGRSLAVDPRYVPFGLPLWVETREPDGTALRRLMVAQDSGAAIKGPVRGDIFWGTGEPALEKAGRMNAEGTYFVLLPRQRGGVLAFHSGSGAP